MAWKFRKPLEVGVAVGVGTALLFASGILDTWSNRASDRLFLSRAADPSITVIAIDDPSILQIGRWPWARQVHADLIRKLAAAGTKVIAYDVNFPEVSDAQNDEALAAALREAGNVVLPVELTFTRTSGGLLYEPGRMLAPVSSIASAAKTTGHTNTPPDSDGVVRSLPLFGSTYNRPDSVPSFSAEIARLAGIDAAVREAPRDRDGRMRVHFPDIPFRAFRTVSAVDVLRDRADLSALKGGVAFVGATAADLHDALLVPTSGGVPMPGVEIHASAYDTLLGRHWLRPVSSWATAIFIVLLGALIGLVIPRTRARVSLPLTVVALLATLVAGFILFDRGYIFDIVWPSIAIVAAYAAVTLERRIASDRERREIRQAFSQYVSSAVVNAILEDPSKLKLGGDRRRMTVLFSDIRGFTTISEGLAPERLVEVLNVYLNRMTEIVFEHGGVLDKYIGDAVMAFWNAPFDQPDHAKRAVRTAIAMRDALDAMNRSGAFGGIDLHIGLGVNTGDMVVGNVGGKSRFDYTVIGDNVNLGSRLEGLTKEYGVGILVSEATQKEIADEILTRRLDKVAVKGKKEPVVIYEVVGALSEASDEQKALVRAFERALDAYFAKGFADAKAGCEEILATHPDDGPSKTLLARAEHFLKEPPPADWAGTWVYTKK